MNSEGPKSTLLQTRVPLDLRAKLEAVAEEAGLTPSRLLRLLIENAVAGEEAPAEPARRRSRARREGKVTVRLAEDVRSDLEAEAKGQGVTVSTWAAVLLAARMRGSPQPVKGERRAIQAAYRQLRGLATNVNQIAYALNRGVLTGAGAALTRDEVAGLRNDIADLRSVVSTYAAGRLTFQSAGVEGADR